MIHAKVIGRPIDRVLQAILALPELVPLTHFKVNVTAVRNEGMQTRLADLERITQNLKSPRPCLVSVSLCPPSRLHLKSLEGNGRRSVGITNWV